MFPLGHTMLPVAAVYAVQRWRGRPLPDLRWVAVGGLLPDAVDKPLRLLGVLDVRGGHWLGHALLVALLLLALALALRQRAWLLPLAVGWLSHGFLDLVLFSEPEAWLWPLLGPFQAGPSDPLGAWSKPLNLAGEVGGAVALALLLWRERLGGRDLLRYLRTGSRT